MEETFRGLANSGWNRAEQAEKHKYKYVASHLTESVPWAWSTCEGHVLPEEVGVLVGLGAHPH